MTKTKTKNPQVPLVVSGYVLFALLILTTLLSTTIPFGLILFEPNVMLINIIVSVIALTVGVLLPVLVGYFIGGASIKSKSVLSHHFNGVLFGLLAFAAILTPLLFIIPTQMFGGDFRLRTIVINLIPSCIVAIVSTFIAVMHVKGRYAKRDIIEYPLFSWVLIVAIFSLVLWSCIGAIVSQTIDTYFYVVVATGIVPLVVVFISLRKTKLSLGMKLTWLAVSVAILLCALYILPQLVSTFAGYLNSRPTMQQQEFENYIAFAIAFLGWAIYWTIQSKRLK